MKRGTVSCFLFAIACIAVTVLSARILGPGFWGTFFLCAGALVAASPHFQLIREFGRIVALLAGRLAFLAAVVGFLASMTGGTFRLPADQAILLLAFAFIAIFGVVAFNRLAVSHDVT